MNNTIKFYSIHGAYGYFSNFSSHEIKLDGKKWLTSEHYFQAQKFEDQKLKTKVRKAKTPGEAAKIGRSRKNPLRRDWESVKINVMKKRLKLNLLNIKI